MGLRKLVFVVAVALGASAFVSGCAVTSSREEAPPVQLAWPAPPDPPRYVFEGVLRSPADVQPENDDQRLRRLLTGQRSIPSKPVYRKPAAISAMGGRIYVADQPSATVVVFDIPRGRVFEMGVREPNDLKKPVSLALDARRNVYVLDATLRKVMVYDGLGLFLFSVELAKEVTQPSGVAVSPDGQKIFVVDRGSLGGGDHKVVAYAPDGRELYRLGPRGGEPGQFNIPVAATVSADGTLWVLDSGNFRVQGFDLEGRHLLSFGSVGNGFGQFSRPRSLATDQDGNIFVSDGSFNNVQIFNPAGELLMWIGKPDLREAPGQFGLVAAVAADETGRLYVADHYHNKIEVYRRALPADAPPGAR